MKDRLWAVISLGGDVIAVTTNPEWIADSLGAEYEVDEIPLIDEPPYRVDYHLMWGYLEPGTGDQEDAGTYTRSYWNFESPRTEKCEIEYVNRSIHLCVGGHDLAAVSALYAEKVPEAVELARGLPGRLPDPPAHPHRITPEQIAAEWDARSTA